MSPKVSPNHKKRPHRLGEASVQVQYGTPGGTRATDSLVRNMEEIVRYKPTVLLATILFLILVVSCGDKIESKDSSLVTTATISSETYSLVCNDCKLVDVNRIIDGDTIDTSVGRVRFYGVNTPEKGERCFQEASDFTRRVSGNKVRIENGPRPTDAYGRRLAYVYESTGESIDAQLISAGFATAWTKDGQHRDQLLKLEHNARKSRSGCLWN